MIDELIEHYDTMVKIGSYFLAIFGGFVVGYAVKDNEHKKEREENGKKLFIGTQNYASHWLRQFAQQYELGDEALEYLNNQRKTMKATNPVYSWNIDRWL